MKPQPIVLGLLLVRAASVGLQRYLSAEYGCLLGCFDLTDFEVAAISSAWTPLLPTKPTL
jgi:hypothetical protein